MDDSTTLRLLVRERWGGDMQLVSFPIFWIFLSLPPAIFPLDLSTSPSYLPPSTLQHAASLINQTLTRITKKWEISSYPSFLSSSYIPSSSWDAMKYKFLSHLSTPNSTFVISFLGGGSTAGYDISSDHVFHILLDEIMKPIFHHINLPLVIRNVGMGGNLCTPYGLCVRTLAGDDADIILWENTFDCGFPECGFILEQFVRQALSSPSHPILAFGSSHFPNWSPTIWETRLIHLCRKTKSCKEINMRPKPPLSNDYDAILQRWQAKGLSAVTHENTQVRMKVLIISFEINSNSSIIWVTSIRSMMNLQNFNSGITPITVISHAVGPTFHTGVKV